MGGPGTDNGLAVGIPIGIPLQGDDIAIGQLRKLDDGGQTGFGKGLAAIGAVRGMGDGTFRPGNSITRQDAAVLLLQSAKALGLTFASAEGLLYGDQSDIAPYARPAVAWASNIRDGVSFNPVMAGVGGGLFAPQGHYTREQAILTLLRLYRSEPVQALSGAVPPTELVP